MKVSDILRVKGGTLYTVAPEEPLARAIDIMAEKDIGSLVVMSHGELVGMLAPCRVERLRDQQRHLFSHCATFRHSSPPRASPINVFFSVSIARKTRVLTAPSEHPAICAISAYDSPW